MSKAGHFERRRRLRDRRYFARLPATALRVLDVLETYADAEGVTWVSPETIATDLEIGVRNVRRAIATLAELGVVTAGKAGAGRGHRFKRAITVPENGAQCARFSGRENRAQGDRKTGRRVVIKPGAGRTENRAQCARRTTHELLKELHNNDVAAGAAGSGCGLLFELVGRRNAEEAIERHGQSHCERVRRLVDLKTENGTAAKPKALAKSLLKMDADEVDFEELDDHVRAQEAEDRRREEDAAFADEVAEARATLDAVPEEQRDAYRALLPLIYPDHRNVGKSELMILTAQLVERFPDGNAALVELRASPQQLDRARKGEIVEHLTL